MPSVASTAFRQSSSNQYPGTSCRGVRRDYLLGHPPAQLDGLERIELCRPAAIRAVMACDV
jgi:hypothetical protein